jgi:glycosyltransferase involved in cell wall biosynthesis
LLRDWQADILHTHHYDQAVIGCLATWLHPKTCLIVGRHYSDAIYRERNSAKQKALLAVEKWVNQSASRIVVPSAYIWELLARRQNVEPIKLCKVPYGFVPEKYRLPSSAEVEQVRRDLKLKGAVVFGNFARLHEEKGQRYLIDAVAQLRPKLPHMRLLIVGEGPERRALGQRIAALGLGDCVSILGWRRDAMTLMAAVHAIVQPTLQEALSQVMVEALWMRKPLIITDVSGAPDIIMNEENGLLVPKADSVSLARAMEKVATDRALQVRLGDAGRAYVEEHLTIQRIISQYERVYEDALLTRSRPESEYPPHTIKHRHITGFAPKGPDAPD